MNLQISLILLLVLFLILSFLFYKCFSIKASLLFIVLLLIFSSKQDKSLVLDVLTNNTNVAIFQNSKVELSSFYDDKNTYKGIHKLNLYKQLDSYERGNYKIKYYEKSKIMINIEKIGG